jgi:hypothetical protein
MIRNSISIMIITNISIRLITTTRTITITIIIIIITKIPPTILVLVIVVVGAIMVIIAVIAIIAPVVVNIVLLRLLLLAIILLMVLNDIIIIIIISIPVGRRQIVLLTSPPPRPAPTAKLTNAIWRHRPLSKLALVGELSCAARLWWCSVVNLWKVRSVCDGLPSIKPVGCKVASAEAGPIWQVMIWALAQAGNRAGKTRHHCAVMRPGAQARLLTWTQLSPHHSTFSKFSFPRRTA